MREEDVTKLIVAWLEDNSWIIVSYDYPGSGTGISLHKNKTIEKNRNSIIPDIIAVKEGEAIVFENKDHYDKRDFMKQHSNIVDGPYSDAIGELLADYHINSYKWGIGIPEGAYSTTAKVNRSLVDFVITVSDSEKFTVF